MISSPSPKLIFCDLVQNLTLIVGKQTGQGTFFLLLKSPGNCINLPAFVEFGDLCWYQAVWYLPTKKMDFLIFSKRMFPHVHEFHQFIRGNECCPGFLNLGQIGGLS